MNASRWNVGRGGPPVLSRWPRGPNRTGLRDQCCGGRATRDVASDGGQVAGRFVREWL